MGLLQLSFMMGAWKGDDYDQELRKESKHKLYADKQSHTMSYQPPFHLGFTIDI